MDLLLRIEPGGRITPIVVGAMTRAHLAPVTEGVSWVGVRFRPGEAFAFLDVAASDAADSFLAPVDAGLSSTDALVEAMGLARASNRMDLIDRWLLARLQRVRPADARVRRAIERLSSTRGNASVADLAVDVHCSERQLERAFAERVGLSPKLFARVVRLQALVRARNDRHRSWSQLAEVDATFAKLEAAGYEGHKAPWDAFWGQRYAIVVDPDGNRVSLFAPLPTKK